MNKKNNIQLVLLLLVIVLGIGYAYINSDLNINGTAKIKNANWDVHWANVQVSSGSVTGENVVTEPTIDSAETTVEYSVVLPTPGTYYEFTVDAVNGGSIDAMIDTIDSKLNGATITTLPAYLEYTVTYGNGIALQPNHELKANTTETYKVKIKYRDDIELTQIPASDQTLSLEFTVKYRQATETSKPTVNPVSFTEDDWSTIVAAVKKGKTENYNVGDTKEIDMGTFGTHTLRIANMSTPTECSTTGFSQTACGFVLEFADVITKRQMNNTSATMHSWHQTDSYSFINTDVYNSLLEVLKNSILDTKIICSHGLLDQENFTVENKLFLISVTEVYGRSSSYYDSAQEQSRQLDYYSSKSVDSYNNHEYVAKKYQNGESQWFSRTILSPTVSNVYIIYGDGGTYSGSISIESGISPAFRIG